MKFKSILLAGAVAALPLVAQQPPPPQPSDMETKETTKVVTVTGKVQSFDVGKSITITKENGDQVTYTILASSEVPKTIEVGKTVTISTLDNSGVPVVKTVTTTTTTKETKKKSY